MLAGNAPKWRDGAILSGYLKDITYQAIDGMQKSLYSAVKYCSEFIDGKGYLPSMFELVECFGDVTYGLAGVTRDKADPINRSLYAIGGSAVGCASTWWLSGRYSNYLAWAAFSGGHIDGLHLYLNQPSLPLAILELPVE